MKLFVSFNKILILVMLLCMGTKMHHLMADDENNQIIPAQMIAKTKENIYSGARTVLTTIKQHPYLTCTLLWLARYHHQLQATLRDLDRTCERHPYMSIFLGGIFIECLSKTIFKANYSSESTQMVLTLS